MKYDISKRPTRGAMRTLAAFSQTMFELLAQKPFEEVTVGELCSLAQYPRATFYNYFDDKYDLLDYCWRTLAELIGLSEYRHAEENEMLYLYFDSIFDFTRQNSAVIGRVLAHNPEAGYMFSSFRNFLNGLMRGIFKDCPDAAKKDIPNELLADHYSSTLFLVWQWAAVKDRTCTKQQAQKYLLELLTIT